MKKALLTLINFPGIIYTGNYKIITDRDAMWPYRLCTALNFIVLNFWIGYYALKPFLQWEVPVEATMVLAAINVILLGAMMILVCLEKRRMCRESEEFFQQIETELNELAKKRMENMEKLRKDIIEFKRKMEEDEKERQ